MVILKLVSWADRPEERGNDPSDILQIISNYFLFEYDEIIDNHYDTFPDEEFDQLRISAKVLGRKVAEILRKSEKLADRVLNILESNTIDQKNSPIAKQWAQKNDWPLDYAIGLLEELKSGIIEILK